MSALRLWLACGVICTAASAVPALELHVAPDGNDAWSGRAAQPNAARSDGPLASLDGARRAIRQLPHPLTEPVQVTFAAGRYRLREEVRFTAEDSGSAAALITYRAAPGAEVVFDGGQPVPGVTQATSSGRERWTGQLPAGTGPVQQLWVEGRRAPRGRAFNAGYRFVRGMEEESPLGNGMFRQKVRLAAEELELFRSASAAEISDAVVQFYHKWDNTRRRVESVDFADRSITVVGGPTKPWNPLDHSTGLQIENLPRLLDEPGEWFVARDGRVTYLPRPGETLGAAALTYPVAPRFLSFLGDAQRKVSGLHFVGLKFRHAKGVDDTDLFNPNQAAVSTVDGVVLLEHAQGLTFRDCEFAHFGGYGISLRQGCVQNRLERCLVTDAGAGAVRIGNLAEAKTPAERVVGNVVHDCILRDGGLLYPCAVGVWVGFAEETAITHNEISDFYYTGISVGWRWGYAASSAKRNRIEWNHIHHLGKGILSDMGGVYTLGPSEGTSVSHNHIHDVRCFSYGGWGLYNDEGSTGITMEGNVVHDTTDGGYHQHYGKDNVVRNNVLAFADLYQFKRSRAEEHRSFTLERNLIVFEKGDLLGGVWTGTTANVLLKGNLYWDYSGRPVTFTAKKLSLAEWQLTGQDAGSVVADPLFVDAAKRDFRLQSGSPATALGFQPIDVGRMGVASGGAWRRLAESFERGPELPPPVRPAPPAIAFQAGFEGTLRNPKAPTAYTKVAISGKGDSLSFTKEHASEGQQCLKFTDAPGLPAHYFPMLTVAPNHAAGVTTCSFDLWLEPKAYVIHEWRDKATPYHTGPTFQLREGKLFGPAGPLMDIPYGRWVRFTVTAALGEGSDGTWSLTVSPEGSAPRTFEKLPFRSKEMRTLDWMGFASNANEASVFFLDRLSLTTTDPNR